MEYKKVIDGIAEFFEGEYFCAGKVVQRKDVEGDEQDPFTPFTKVFISQGGGGISGDDYHGTAYFHIGNNWYATAAY